MRGGTDYQQTAICIVCGFTQENTITVWGDHDPKIKKWDETNCPFCLHKKKLEGEK